MPVDGSLNIAHQGRPHLVDGHTVSAFERCFPADAQPRIYEPSAQKADQIGKGSRYCLADRSNVFYLPRLTEQSVHFLQCRASLAINCLEQFKYERNDVRVGVTEIRHEFVLEQVIYDLV